MKIEGKIGRNGQVVAKGDYIITPLQLRVQYIKKDGTIGEDVILGESFAKNLNQGRIDQAIVSQEIVKVIACFSANTYNGRTFQRCSFMLPKEYYKEM